MRSWLISLLSYYIWVFIHHSEMFRKGKFPSATFENFSLHFLRMDNFPANSISGIFSFLSFLLLIYYWHANPSWIRHLEIFISICSFITSLNKNYFFLLICYNKTKEYDIFKLIAFICYFNRFPTSNPCQNRINIIVFQLRPKILNKSYKI